MSDDGRALLSMAFLALAALLYFGLPQIVPPKYVRIGPFEAGELPETTCHGIAHDGSVFFEVCK